MVSELPTPQILAPLFYEGMENLPETQKILTPVYGCF
jgi:hypothetical protein